MEFGNQLKRESEKAATICTVDYPQQEAFIKGAKWAVDYFANQLRPGTYENCKGYPKTLLDAYTLEGIREVFMKMLVEK